MKFVRSCRLLAAIILALALIAAPVAAGAQPAVAHTAPDPPPDPTPGTLSTTTPTVSAGVSITFSYSTPAANVPVANDNWIGIYSESGGCAPVDNGYGGCGSTAYQYALGASGTLSFDTTALAAGSYYAYYLYDNEYYSLAPDITFTVTAGAPTGTLATTTPTLTQGDPLSFSYATSEADLNSENWIGIYSNPGCGPVNGTDVCGSTIWQYTPALSGTATFATASLSPGKYVAFYLYDNGYTSLAPPVDFTVKAIKPVAAPTYVSATRIAGLDDPQAVAQGPGGRLWVVNTGANKVEEVSATTSRVIRTLGGRGRAPGQLMQPRAVAVDRAGHVFVADTGNNRVEEYSIKGKLLASIGKRGAGHGDFDQPEGVAVHDGILYVSDDVNNRIETFTIKTGAYRSSITTDVSSPGGLTVDADGDLWAAQQGQTDTALDGFVEYSPKGAVIVAVDDNNTTTYGGFTDPSDVAVDTKGHVFVAEPDLDYVQEFTATGVFLNEFGTTGRGTLSYAAGVVVTHSGRILVADSGNDRLVTFKES